LSTIFHDSGVSEITANSPTEVPSAVSSHCRDQKDLKTKLPTCFKKKKEKKKRKRKRERKKEGDLNSKYEIVRMFQEEERKKIKKEKKGGRI